MAQSPEDKLLARALVRTERIDEASLDALIDRDGGRTESLRELILAEGLLSPEELESLLARVSRRLSRESGRRRRTASERSREAGARDSGRRRRTESGRRRGTDSGRRRRTDSGRRRRTGSARGSAESERREGSSSPGQLTRGKRRPRRPRGTSPEKTPLARTKLPRYRALYLSAPAQTRASTVPATVAVPLSSLWAEEVGGKRGHDLHPPRKQQKGRVAAGKSCHDAPRRGLRHRRPRVPRRS